MLLIGVLCMISKSEPLAFGSRTPILKLKFLRTTFLLNLNTAFDYENHDVFIKMFAMCLRVIPFLLLYCGLSVYSVIKYIPKTNVACILGVTNVCNIAQYRSICVYKAFDRFLFAQFNIAYFRILLFEIPV